MRWERRVYDTTTTYDRGTIPGHSEKEGLAIPSEWHCGTGRTVNDWVRRENKKWRFWYHGF